MKQKVLVRRVNAGWEMTDGDLCIQGSNRSQLLLLFDLWIAHKNKRKGKKGDGKKGSKRASS